jgi:hypothetical protein
MATTTYDTDGTHSVTALVTSKSVLVTHDSGSGSDIPTVTLNTAAALGNTITIESSNGAIADVVENLNALGSYVIDANGGTVDLSSTISALSTNNITIENGGTVTAGEEFISLLTGSAVNFGAGAGNEFVINSSGLLDLTVAAPITGFGTGDKIVDETINYAAVTNYTITNGAGSQTLTFTGAGGATLGILTFAANTFSGGTNTYAAGTGPVGFSSAGGDLVVNGCFLPGAHIATANGETRVEDLREGDLVATLVDGGTVMQPVTWIGNRTVRLTESAPADSYPVRIRAGAFDDGLPHRDLLVTGDHCMLLHGGLIPARMLVNGGSIILDRRIRAFTYYHVELARHGILLAEGLATESYLDTGNRGNFSNAAVPALRPDFALNAAHKSWAQNAAAPLVTDRDAVEPIWRALADRAAALGLMQTVNRPALTTAPDLLLLTDTGAEIRPVIADGIVHSFALPAGAKGLRLRSRTARPADVVGPFLDDRRELGVAVGLLSLWSGRRRTVTVDQHLTGTYSGWHAAEPAAKCRWTNGDAELPLDAHLPRDQPILLRIEIVQAGPYLAEPAAEPAKAA